MIQISFMPITTTRASIELDCHYEVRFALNSPGEPFLSHKLWRQILILRRKHAQSQDVCGAPVFLPGEFKAKRTSYVDFFYRYY